MRHAIPGFLMGIALTLAISAYAQKAPPQTQSQASIVNMAKAPLRRAPSGKAELRILAKGDQAFIGHLSMAAGAKVPLHRDESEEYIHILEGSGTITIDGHASTIGPGSTVYMPANAEVTFTNDDKALKGLQVFAPPTSARKYDGWKVIK